MFNQIVAVVLSLLLLTQQSIGQPLAHPEDEPFINSTSSLVWQPEEIEAKISDYEFTVWLLPASKMQAPIAGYLIKKSHWIEIRRITDHLNDEINRVKKEARDSCDLLLAKKDADCKDINKNLRESIDKHIKDIDALNKDKKTLTDNMFYWQIGTASAGILALSFGLLAISK